MSTYITALVAGAYHVVRSEYTPRRRRDPAGRRLPPRRSPSTSTPTRSSTSPGRASTSSSSCSTTRTRSPSTTSCSCPSTTRARWRTPGCVTFLEDYVFRSKVTDAAYERRAETILHELAHMWFGDLVTMRWWDDLWLNESFATYISVLCQAEATRWTQRVDHLRQRREDLGLPAGPAALAPTRSSPTSPTWRTSRSTSTASPTPRAPRCSSSWWPGSAGTTSSTAIRTLLRPPRVGQHHPERPARAARGDLRPRPVGLVGRSGCRPPASTPCARSTPSTTTALHRVRGAAGGAGGLPDAALAPGRRSASTTCVDGSWCCTDRDRARRLGAKTDVPELVGTQAARPRAGQRRRPHLRQDPPRRALAGHGRPAHRRLRRLAAPRAVLGRGLGHDPGRRDCPRATTSSWCCAASAGRPTSASCSRCCARRGGAHSFADPDCRRPPAGRPCRRSAGAPARRRARQRPAAGLGARLRLGRPHRRAAGPARRAARRATGPSPGLTVDAELRWHLLRRLVSCGAAADAAEIDAELDRDDTAAGQRHAAGARAARPTRQAKAEAWASVVVDDAAQRHAGAVIGGFAQAEQVRAARARSWSATSRPCRRIWAERTNEIAQNIVIGFYPSWRSRRDRRAAPTLPGHRDPAPLRAPAATRPATACAALRARECDRAAG